ncbi:MAG: hypothetical protein JO323_15935 [Acidobacteriia bacterium]|nr:hypothetical protein [Terriglobia bacterium]
MAQDDRAVADAGDDQQRGGRQPVDKFREGPFQVSIWENPSSKGDFRTATLDRRYKDKEGQFQTSHSYTASDLEHMEKAAREARLRIARWQEENRAQQQDRTR